jgi:hypothetical protein
MIIAQPNIDTATARTSHRSERPAPDAAFVAAELLGIADLSRTERATHPMGWLCGRLRALAELSRIAAEHGNDAAKDIANAVMARVNDGTIKTTREARDAARQLALKLAEAHA